MATNFFQRWSQRKIKAKDEGEVELEQELVEQKLPSSVLDSPSDNEVVEREKDDNGSEYSAIDTAEEQADASLPELTLADAAKVTFDSGVSTFMKAGVEKSVKKAALRKLFHSDEFNYISDMDDHTEDFSNVPVLDTKVTQQLRQWVNHAAEKVEEAINAPNAPLATEDGAHSVAAIADQRGNDTPDVLPTDESAEAAEADVETGVAFTIPTEMVKEEPEALTGAGAFSDGKLVKRANKGSQEG
ncbi:DUF3306 domain-containing protein [Photobacterium sp. DA100]|uniref:DUF3306 domain-containing protein n=1 Tax=Photobacterium sp. DA100 TaxID=3027472 RepID=UPI00247A2F61|nr:DUF3306 domain-containing protein [Photobacterium sp. DA100]WEM40847.1 DUF3306 domain-containing protein [Photobacterium sp. DA100]